MPNNYSAILADIKTKLESVTDIGVIHDYERWIVDPSKFIALFAFTPAGGVKQIRGWEITRISASEHLKGAFFRHHKFKLNGYLGLKDADATGKTFQVLIEEICAKFRGAVTTQAWDYRDGDNPGNAPAQVMAIDTRMYGELLCHCTEIHISITERILP